MNDARLPVTERLYYAEPSRTEFDATVIAAERDGDRVRVFLDRTAFYPTSGGQPFDMGTLTVVQQPGTPGTAVAVLDVIDGDDGRIVHVVEGELPVGATVAGRVDWPRRFDHMQQHTGQHVLSAAFDRLFGIRTESFHLGSAVSTIDLGMPVGPSEIARALAEANRIVWDDRPVAIRFVTAEEAAALPLRKEPVRDGTLRLIDIQEYDLSACGGTHVARTGAIGMIGVTAWEKFRGGVRVTFVCGGRALDLFASQRDAITSSVRVLSVLPEELPTAIERLQLENKELRRTIKDQQGRLADYEAAAVAARGLPGRGGTAVIEALEGYDANGLRMLASAITSRPGYAVVLVSSMTPATVVVARSKDVNLDAAAVLKTLTERFGGRGGGRPDMAQGGGLAGEIAEIIAAARAALGVRSG